MPMRKPVEKPGGVLANRVRERRDGLGLSQGEAARRAGITRQALSAVEAGHYGPSTEVALRLAGVLQCRVEDLFALRAQRKTVAAELVGSLPRNAAKARVKIFRVGDRTVAMPLSALGSSSNFTLPADGLVTAVGSSASGVQVDLLGDRSGPGEHIAVGGCNPAVSLAGHYLRGAEQGELLCLSMGSEAAVQALRRGELHVAGVHLAGGKSGENSLPYLSRRLRGMEFIVVTFALWEEGLIVATGNPKRIRAVTDLGRRDVRVINREQGSGARRLLDTRLSSVGIDRSRLKGYSDLAYSQLDLGWMISRGFADAGVGAKVAACFFGLEFIPLQQESYDLVVPKSYLTAHPLVERFLDVITVAPLRAEVEALGGYDTRDAGKIVARGAAG
jgi:molybdopterin molybdotransferase/putative molybdopterin biosynthesis protein